MANPEDDWFTAAKLLRPQGRKGELLAEPHTEPASIIAGKPLWLTSQENTEPGPDAERELEAVWQPKGKNAGRIVLKLAGVDSISAAEAIAGHYLRMRASELPVLEQDTFRVRDLVGCSLFDHERRAGTVVDVQFPIAADGHTRLSDAPDLLAVRPLRDDGAEDTGGEPVLIPFVRSWLVEVDLATKRIMMELPPGLFDAAPGSEPDSEPDSDSSGTLNEG